MKYAALTHVASIGIVFAALISTAPASIAQPHAQASSAKESGEMADLHLERKVGMKMRFNKGNTFGWSLMSNEERAAHRQKMLATKTYEECKSLQNEHHLAMEARAKEKGKTLPEPRQMGCDRMQALDKFK